ncbi:radical SAM protein [Clostridium sp.]|uniref:radical SAM protein n=1 Tax=Clostridium sp. TaxID=1506 RepID=UPI002FCC3C99
MRYEGTVYRPPSEAYSLIIQATIGCSHNRCSFCSMYKDKKFRIRDLEHIIEDLNSARKRYPRVEKLFLADGDALIMKTEDLITILKVVRELFPECKRLGVYGSPKSILRKSHEDLNILKEHGLGIIYLGIESGSDKILEDINKGVTAKEIIEAGKKVRDSKIALSVTLISGIGGKENTEKHALESAKVINDINPDYLGILTLMVEEGTELQGKINSGEFSLLTPREVMEEMKLFIEKIQVQGTVFRSNHASNYINLGGVLSVDKNKILQEIHYILENNSAYKDEKFRGL